MRSCAARYIETKQQIDRSQRKSYWTLKEETNPYFFRRIEVLMNQDISLLRVLLGMLDDC